MEKFQSPPQTHQNNPSVMKHDSDDSHQSSERTLGFSVPLKPAEDEAFLRKLLAEDSDSGEPVPPLTYLKHVVLPEDTLAGLCVKYKITPLELRRANNFSGNNLQLAPSVLLIPQSTTTSGAGALPQDTNSEAYKLQALRLQFPTLEEAHAHAFLENHKWDLKAATQSLLSLCS
jgi:hypothetical protein